jgi:hypothetical protein
VVTTRCPWSLELHPIKTSPAHCSCPSSSLRRHLRSISISVARPSLTLVFSSPTNCSYISISYIYGRSQPAISLTTYISSSYHSPTSPPTHVVPTPSHQSTSSHSQHTHYPPVLMELLTKHILSISFLPQSRSDLLAYCVLNPLVCDRGKATAESM